MINIKSKHTPHRVILTYPGDRLEGANLRDANLRGADLRDANLRGADLRDANLRGADLRGADLRYADLRDANLRDADLRYADLRDANLRGADLRYANLRYANLRDANLRDADLRGANLGGANLRGANPGGANLGDANLRGADLRGANLGGANLRGANLRYTDLGGANLGGANLRGANLRDANLRDADLRGAQGIDARRTTPLLILADQVGPLRAYKLVTNDYTGPNYKGLEYRVGSIISDIKAETDPLISCAEGVNLATLDWVIREWCPSHRIMQVEFDRGQLACIPTATDGKFRTTGCRVLKEMDLVELGLVSETEEDNAQ